MNNNQQLYPCSKYEEAAKQLLKKVEEAKSLADVRKLFCEFSKHYTVLPNLWREWLLNEVDDTYADYQASKEDFHFKKIQAQARTHFYYFLFLNYNYKSFMQGKFGRSFNWDHLNRFPIDVTPSTAEPFSGEILYPTLVYPHDGLKTMKNYAKMYSSQPLPPALLKEYREAQKISYEMWLNHNKTHGLEVLQESWDDKTLILENFECAIGFLPCNKKLWKMYIEFLKMNQMHKKLLDVYLRYCRLFIDDVEMRNEYQNELEEKSLLGMNTSKWWIDLIEFELYFGEIGNARKLLDKALKCSNAKILFKYGLWFEKKYGNMKEYMSMLSQCKTLYPEIDNNDNFIKPIVSGKPEILYEYKNNYTLKNEPKKLSQRTTQPFILQSFSLPDTLIYYLTKTCSPSTKLKLYKSAKYFYFAKKSPSPLCHTLTVMDGLKSEDPIYFPHSLFITSAHSNFIGLQNLTITNTLIIYPRNIPTFFTNLLQKNVELKVQHLVLTSQHLSFTDLKLLTTLKLKVVKLDEVKISKNMEFLVAVEEIIPMFYPVKELRLLKPTFSEATPKLLAKLEREIKIRKFELSEIDETFRSEYFIKFAENNFLFGSSITVGFSPLVIEEVKAVFLTEVNAELPKFSLAEKK